MSDDWAVYLAHEHDQRPMLSKGLYCLVDPRTGRPRYVGRTFDFQTRLAAHISAARKNAYHTSKWITELADNGLAPIMVALDPDMAREYHWVCAFLDLGEDLLNGTRDRRYAATSPRRGGRRNIQSIIGCASRVIDATIWLQPYYEAGQYWILTPSEWDADLIRLTQARERRREIACEAQRRMDEERTDYILGDGLVNDIRGRLNNE